MSELSRLAIECCSAARARARLYNRSIDKPFGQRSSEDDREAKIQRDGSDDNRWPHSRNSATPAFHGKSRTRLSCARTFGENIERRRVAENPSGCATRFEFAGRTLCPGRTNDRFASAR